jgi:hypothetical protein
MTIYYTPALLSVKHIVAYILRVLYLWCTTRPRLGWMESNNTLHIAEAIGLHPEFSESCNSRDMIQKASSLESDLRLRSSG